MNTKDNNKTCKQTHIVIKKDNKRNYKYKFIENYKGNDIGTLYAIF